MARAVSHIVLVRNPLPVMAIKAAPRCFDLADLHGSTRIPRAECQLGCYPMRNAIDGRFRLPKNWSTSRGSAEISPLAVFLSNEEYSLRPQTRDLRGEARCWASCWLDRERLYCRANLPSSLEAPQSCDEAVARGLLRFTDTQCPWIPTDT